MPDLDPSIILRDAVVGDAAGMVRVHYRAVHVTAAGVYPPDVLRSWSPAPESSARRGRFERALAAGEERFIVALTGEGLVCGFGVVLPAAGELRAIYVDPAFGRRGIGAAILARLERIAADRGCERLRLDASLNAEAFYSRHGYAVESRGTHRLADGAEMACVKMFKRLTLVG